MLIQTSPKRFAPNARAFIPIALPIRSSSSTSHVAPRAIETGKGGRSGIPCVLCISTRYHVQHSWICEYAARHHCSLFGRTKLRRQLAGSRHYIVDHRAAIFLPSGGTRYLALTFSACCTDFGISTQRNPRWFVPVVTSPFPRVPTMYREQY